MKLISIFEDENGDIICIIDFIDKIGSNFVGSAVASKPSWHNAVSTDADFLPMFALVGDFCIISWIISTVPLTRILGNTIFCLCTH